MKVVSSEGYCYSHLHHCLPVLLSFLRLQKCSAHARKILCTPIQYSTFYASDQARKIKLSTKWFIETAQSSRLKRASNFRASWPKKIWLWVSYDSITTKAVPHVVFFSVKLESCFVVQAFVPVSYRCLSCSTAAKHTLAFQRIQGSKNVPCGPVPSWKLLYMYKFRFLPGYQLDKTDMRFCQVDLHVEVDGWRVSSCFYIVAMAFQ